MIINDDFVKKYALEAGGAGACLRCLDEDNFKIRTVAKHDREVTYRLCMKCGDKVEIASGPLMMDEPERIFENYTIVVDEVVNDDI